MTLFGEGKQRIKLESWLDLSEPFPRLPAENGQSLRYQQFHIERPFFFSRGNVNATCV